MLTQRDEENHDALREEDVWKLDLQELYEGDIDDVLHTVSGNTHAENLCHAIVRCTVQNALLQDQRVQAIFEQWAEDTGTLAAAQRLADALAMIAERYHYQSVLELLDAARHGQLEQRIASVSEEERRQYVCVEEVFDACCDALDNRWEQLATALFHFVTKELRLPWPWLVCVDELQSES